MAAQYHQLNFRMPNDLVEQLRIVARSRRISVTQAIQEAVDKAVEEHGRSTTVRLQIRLPLSLHEAVKAAAKTQGRSINSEMVTRLHDSF